MTRVLPLFVILFALVSIGATLGWLPRAALFAAKPLATLLIAVHAVGGRRDLVQRRLIVTGLMFSFAGDIALLWPREGLLPGLAAFFVVNLCYVVAFKRRVGFAARPGPFVVCGAIAAAILAWVWSDLGTVMRLVVAAYLAGLASMTAQSIAAWQVGRGAPDEPLARRGAIGGVLFMACEVAFALDTAAWPMALALYWSGQWLIASSLARPSDGIRAVRRTATSSGFNVEAAQ